MVTITVEEIQRDLMGYLDRVRAGETVVIVEEDQPIAELRPVERVALQPRPFGLCAGQFRVPDDFDAPLPEEILDAFETT